MSLSVGVDAQTAALLTAIGLTDDDGQVIAAWFNDPVGAARGVLSNPRQRTALLRLLDTLLPADAETPGWHPLLDHNFGNIYLTVENDVIGVAAALRTRATSPGAGVAVRGSVRLPLVDVSGDLRAVAGTAEGPILIGVDLEFTDSSVPLDGIGAAVSVDAEREATARFTLRGLDVGAGPVDLTVDSGRIGSDLVAALRLLLREVTRSLAPDGTQIARLSEHLFELLGIGSETIPSLPLEHLLADPAVVIDWLVDVVDTPETLTAWATHLAGLIGDDLPVSGDATASAPLRAPLLGSGSVELDLIVRLTESGEDLEIGLEATVSAGAVDLAAEVTALRIPLPTGQPGAAARVTQIVPAAAVVLIAPGTGQLVSNAPTLQVGTARAGLRLVGGQVQPWLALTEVELDSVKRGTVDLTDADAVTDLVADSVLGLLEQAFGDSAQARALLALLGLRDPTGDADTPHHLDPLALGRGPTAALAALHRAVLADAEHPWSHLFAEVATLIGLTGGVTGSGTPAAPWQIPIATLGPVTFALAAWNARTDQTPAGEQQLRLGLLAEAGADAITSRLLVELLAVDLPQASAGVVTLVGWQEFRVTFSPSAAVEMAGGLSLSAQSAVGTATWRPGSPLRWQVALTGVTAEADGQTYGPLTWTLPADLQLGEAAADLVRRLLSAALQMWGGDAAYAVGAALGLHRGLPELPSDWPLLDGPGGLATVLADPVAALRMYVRRLVTEVSTDGQDFATSLLQILAGLLPGSAGTAARELRTASAVAGTGRYDDPWAVPLADKAQGNADLLVWLEPDGPPASWIAALADQADGVVDGDRLSGFLVQASAFHPALSELLNGRDGAELGTAFASLTDWLGQSDGLVPLTSQLPDGATWQHGATVAAPHGRLPRDPQVIAQIIAQLTAWGGNRPVVLMTPAFADHTQWTDLLTAAAPEHPPGAHFDLRGLPNPAEVDLSTVTAQSTFYTVDLLPDRSLSEVDQLDRVVRRVLTITGATSVYLVGHSTAGVTARLLAAAHRELVSGLVTIGTPHAGSLLSPLTDADLASAVRVAAALAKPIADTALGATVEQLAALLDRSVGSLGDPIQPAWFTGVPAGLVDAVPGLAIGSQLGGDFLGLLAGATVTALAAGDPPTHLAVGLRLGLDTPAAGDGEVALTASVRLDLARLRLVPQAPEPVRPATAITVRTEVWRPGGWLVGQDLLVARVAQRVRRLEAAVKMLPGAVGSSGEPGTIATSAWLRLYEAGLNGVPVTPRLQLGDPDLRPALDAVLAVLAATAPNSAGQAALDLMRAGGLVFDTSAGVRASLTGLADLTQVPLRTLVARRDVLLQALRRAIGQAAGPLTVSLTQLPIELALDDTAHRLRLRSTADVVLAGPFAAQLDLTIDTTTFATDPRGALLAGPLTLARASDGTIAVSAPPWLPELVLRPYDSDALEAQLTHLLPELGASVMVSALLGELAGAAVTVGPIYSLVRDPVGWLRRGGALGTDGHLDGGKINALLQTIATALSLDAKAGLGLPGGYLLSAAGTDPVRLTLTGTFGEVAEATVTANLGVDLHRDGHATATGTITLAVVLPGDWGPIAIAFSLDATGVGLVVTPTTNAKPIRLLPTVDGLGAVVGGATAMLPSLLQRLVVTLRAQPGPHDILSVALRIATGLGIYADDAAGFTEPSRAARLRGMLTPGWLSEQVSDPTALVDLVNSLFEPTPVINLPAGHKISRTQDRLRWAMPLFADTATDPQPDEAGIRGCELGAEVGWSAAGEPQVLVTLTGLSTGPVTVVEARLGYLDGLTGRLRLRIEVGGALDFFTPELDLDVADGRLTAQLLPLGPAAAPDCAVVLLPTPHLTLTTHGGLELAGSWLIPLLTRFILPEVEALLGQRLWPGGPVAKAILSGAGLVAPDPAPLQVVHPLPPLPAVALGALVATLDGATVHLTETLDLSAVTESGRIGLRLHGCVDMSGEDISVSIRFGYAHWLTDKAAGITVWVLKLAPDANPPVELEPRLSVIGLGALLSGGDGKLLVGGGGPEGSDESGGPFQLGGAGAFVFFEADFLDQGHVAFQVSHLGGAVELVNAAIRLDSDDADSFVAKVLPKELAAPFSMALAVREGSVEIHGSVGGGENGIQLTFPLDRDLFGVIFLRELVLSALVDDGRTSATAAISANASLGPLAVNITRVGLQALIDASGAHLAFKSPDGFGLSLDASVVRAGGFLEVDARRGRYVGAIELSIFKKFDLTAIGIVTTKRGDGSPGFSLLMLITVSLPVPIPIGYGFFFAGAGGLLAVNRGMDVDRIRDRLRAGTADSILFPTDIVRRIDVIIRDLEESFPQAEGRFLIAPMAIITWMNPALVTLKIGLIIEIALQPKIALLGVLRLALPTPDAAVVDFKVAFLGSIDFAAGLLSFDAAIYDSFIGYGDFKLSLEGDIAIRVSWGSSPDLVASVGGFHPSYRPAPQLRLPPMRRITLSLLKDNPRLTLRLYFAVTSNTVQFGAELEFFAGVEGFSITGNLGFDVLVQIVPFLIDAHMWGRLAVKLGDTDICSISLDLQLRGPAPWIARGRASFSILFISITVEVEARFGEELATTLPNQPILNRFLDTLRDAANWTAELTVEASPAVTLMPPAPGVLVVDAGGLLTVRQNLLPLATDIGLVGSVPPADVRRVSISQLGFVPSGAPAVWVEHEDVLASFAPSSFAGAPAADADRLKAPAFEQRPNGVKARIGSALAGDFVLPHAVSYEQIILDDPDAPVPPPKPAVPSVSFGALVAGALGGSAGSRRRREDAEMATVRKAREKVPLFAVAALDDLRPLDDTGKPLNLVDGQGPQDALLPLADAESRLAILAATTGGRFQILPEVQVV